VKEARSALASASPSHTSFIINPPSAASSRPDLWAECNRSRDLCWIERALHIDGCANTQKQFQLCWKRVMEV
jgi:hypothetical protein